MEEAVAKATADLALLQERHEALLGRFQVQQGALQQLSEQVQKLEMGLGQAEGGRDEWRQVRSLADRLAQQLATLEGDMERQQGQREEQQRHLELLSQRVQEQAQSLLVLQQQMEDHRQRTRATMKQVLQLLERQRRRLQDVIRQEIQEIRGGMEQTEQ